MCSEVNDEFFSNNIKLTNTIKKIEKNNKILIINIINELEKVLKPNRIKHSRGVAKAAVKLGLKYNCDCNKLYIAGLLHDIAKRIDKVEVNRLVKTYDIKLDELEKENLALSHGILGAYLVKEKFNILDKEVLNSIKYHTTGRIGMSVYEEIIFIADLIEENRDFEGVELMRDLAYNGKMKHAIAKSYDNTIVHVINKGELIHMRSVETRNFYIKFLKNKK